MLISILQIVVVWEGDAYCIYNYIVYTIHIHTYVCILYMDESAYLIVLLSLEWYIHTYIESYKRRGQRYEERNDKDMTKIWQWYDKDMIKLWQRYDKDLTTIWQIYDKDMTNITGRCKWTAITN